MRISDWSSDVCSSDLLGPDVRQARRSGQPRPDGPRDRQNRTVHLQPVLLDTRGEGEDKAVGIFPVFMHVAQGDVAHQNGAVKKPGIVTEGDRKSVVEGKRVSVRVDIGGRGIYKKKKKQDTKN